MAERNWASISSGATFEALMSALIFFEDPRAAVFGREGRDGGQDARSGDGTVVFQAKFHVAPSAAKAISDAKSEATKIAKYKTPGHAREPQWAGVTEWRLVTNAPFNPTDHQRWLEDVVPLFQKLGLQATYWERGHLDVLLDRHPSVHRSFFDGEPRAVLTLQEAAEAIEQDVPFLPRATRVGFHGRADELEEAVGVVESGQTPFLVLHGPGGVGKTRLMFEVGSTLADKRWQVLWANKDTMSNGRWYEGIIPERSTVLLVDEPDNEVLLRQLVEQVGIGRAGGWRVVVNVRSPKDPVLKFLGKPGQKRSTTFVEVGPLAASAAEALAGELIDSSPTLSSLPADRRKEAAERLAKDFDRFPVWISLAVDLLERHGDLANVPDSVEALADAYLDEVYTHQAGLPPATVETLLRWVALLETTNSEDDSELDMLRQMAGLPSSGELQRALGALVNRKIVARRGARDRLLEVKPDVMRDHVLRQWLLVWSAFGKASWLPTGDANVLIDVLVKAVVDGSFSQRHRRMMRSLARCEATLLQSDRPDVPLLRLLIEGFVAQLPSLSASKRVLLAEVLVPIAPLRPVHVLDLCHRLLADVCDDDVVETLLGSRTVTHDEVVLELSWLAFHAAMGVRETSEQVSVLETFASLVEAEHGINGRRGRLPNDGKRAAQLAERVVQGGDAFWSDFSAEAADFVEHALGGAELPDSASLAVLGALAKPLLAVERTRTETNERGITIQNYIILPGGAEWARRDRIRAAVRGAISRHGTGVPGELWELLAFSHSTALRAREHVKDDAHRAAVVADSLGDLQWAEQVLAGRSQNLRELAAARRLWNWHQKFDEREEFKAVAERLEAIYLSNNLSAEFEPLTTFDAEDSAATAAKRMAEALATQSAAEIEAMLGRATQFFAQDNLQPVYRVATYLGDVAAENPAVRDFVTSALTAPTDEPRFTFATIVVRTWLATLRLRGQTAEVLTTLSSMLEVPQPPLGKSLLVAQIYESYLPERYGDVAPEEHHEVLATSAVFAAAEREDLFTGALGWSFVLDWPAFRSATDTMLAGTPADRQAVSVRRLFDSMHWGARWLKKRERPFPGDLPTWLVDRLVVVPDLDELGDGAHWHLEEMLKSAGRPSVTWLADALERREKLAESKDDDAYGFPFRRRLSMYVAPLTPEDTADPTVNAAVDAILARTDDSGRIGYQLPRYAHDIDPRGVAVPDKVAAIIRGLPPTAYDAAWRWARYAGVYANSQESWRTIAKEVCRFAAKAPDGERISLFQSLKNPVSTGWSLHNSEVPQGFVDGVAHAQAALEAETDPDLVPFRQWQLKCAQAELEWQEEHAKEERGE